MKREIKRLLFLGRTKLLLARTIMEQKTEYDFDRVILTDVISKINKILEEPTNAEDKEQGKKKDA